MKKNIFGKLLCLLMAVGMAFGMTACGGNNGGNTGDGGDKGTECTVTFDMQGHGGTAPDSQTVDKGSHATEPTPAPTDADWNFGGWYKEAACTNSYDFSTETVTANITLYAKWTPKQQQGDQPQPPAQDTSVALTGNVYVVGDSTVCDYERTGSLDDAYLPRYGYGTQLYNYLNCNKSQIINLARSGRSSLDYLKEGDYQTLLAGLKAGDYLIIGFGHNDEKDTDAERFTDANGTYDVAQTAKGPSFAYNLYENYVKVAVEKGATPILCTPVVRYDASGSYTGDKIHATANGDYAQAIKTLGEATNTAVVDLRDITKEIYKADNTAAQYFHKHSGYSGEKPNETPIGRDDTHLNMYGAKRVAYELLKALPADCSLKASVRTNAVCPTYENDFAAAIKADYVQKPYTAPVLGTPIANTATATPAAWYKSAFGDLGGNTKVNNFTFAYTEADGKFTIDNSTTATGKFSSAGDGLGTIFVQIDSGKNFTASASIKLTTPVSDPKNQAGFGMMLRDDMYMNIGKDIVVNSNYIAVGGLGTNAIFKREETALIKESGMSTTINATNTYDVSISRQGQKITVTFSDGTNEYSKDYLDVKMDVKDSEYMYLCLFVNRGFAAEFTNVQFEITGDAGEA